MNDHIFLHVSFFVQLLELPVLPLMFQLTSVLAFVLSKTAAVNAKL